MRSLTTVHSARHSQAGLRGHESGASTHSETWNGPKVASRISAIVIFSAGRARRYPPCRPHTAVSREPVLRKSAS